MAEEALEHGLTARPAPIVLPAVQQDDTPTLQPHR